jgi:hypothetical protein
MTIRTMLGLVLSAVALQSCGGHQAVQISPDAQSVATRWNGTLSSPPALAGVSAIRGAAWMGMDEKHPDQTAAHVDISNAVPKGVHPWHVHRGKCGADQGILGSADAYQPLKVDGDGRASSTATLQIPEPKTGEYFVNVHASAANMNTIVACGNLAPPSR